MKRWNLYKEPSGRILFVCPVCDVPQILPFKKCTICGKRLRLPKKGDDKL